ncbi:MAG: bifunctional phosphoribosylaminoimidazolecarboxamide formyltransferase/IMP cyclohydrolase [Bacteroidia bacterium]|nr:bifunctional phosphoribosylaminoimidazolecarboxamide formyltransferase/IMP cyclohydrolase [Bacteroidia bacterium]
MSNNSKKIHSALISVYHKDNLEPIVKQLNALGVKIYSTGGTLKFIQDLSIPAIAVESTIGFPEILDGRVKTLHPVIFGGILARRDNPNDMAQLAEHGIGTLDLVIVDLYPFEDTVKSTNDADEIIEKIDIGGISLIRAAAKNFNDTLIVSDRNQYNDLIRLLNEKNGSTDLADRKSFAAKAFMTSSHYDSAIFNYFNAELEIPAIKVSYSTAKSLRYGENPHQVGTYYGHLDELFDVLNGKELSYNNLVDVDASLQIISEFDETTFAIIKHTNSCGLASRSTVKDAYEAALAGDPTSAFGGVLACNNTIDLDAANAINSLFFEVISAPDYTNEALEVLKSKKNRIILKLKKPLEQKKMFKSLLNGVLEQTLDKSTENAENFNVVTKISPSNEQMKDLEFAIKAVKHLKSNGITLVKNAQLIGMGCGQTSRVDALESAIKKAKAFGFDTNGAVMASEAFFPFPDCVSISGTAGIVAIAQPGGSIKDQDSILEADKNGQAMVLTGFRHFKH